MLQIASYHDFAREPEAFYHGLMIGFTVSLHSTGKYEVCSNRESGFGRFDIMLIPDDKTKLGIIMELKNSKCSPNVGATLAVAQDKNIPEKNNENQNLMKLAKEAIQQIDKRKYTEEFKQRGIPNILKIGIGFCGKEFELVSST